MTVKRYKALMQQPTPTTIDATVLVDDFGGRWERFDAGIYHYYEPNQFQGGTLYIPSYINGNAGGTYIDYNGVFRSLSLVDTHLVLWVGEGVLSDGFIGNFPIEFEFYIP